MRKKTCAMKTEVGVLKYKPGKLFVADALSRQYLDEIKWTIIQGQQTHYS